MGEARGCQQEEVTRLFEWYEGDVEDAEARLGGPPPPSSVVFYGSSSIRLWTTLAQDFAGTPVVNLGFGGSTLAACAYFFERLVVPCSPRSIVFYAGDNDLGDGQSATAVLASLGLLLSKLDNYNPNLPFGFISVKPSPVRWPLIDRIRAVNRGAQTVVSARPNGFYLDVFTPMLADNGGSRPELFQPDGLHMNQDGYRIWWQVISSRRRDLLL